MQLKFFKKNKNKESESIFFHKSVFIALLKIIIPASISMAIYSLYTIIDQVIAIKLGEGLQWGTGTSQHIVLNSSDIRTIIQICLPYYSLIIAGLAMISGGLSNYLSFHFGKKDIKNAIKTLGNSLFINIIIVIGFLIFALSFSNILIKLQLNNTNTNPKDLAIANIAKWICWTWTFAILFYYVSNIIIWTIRTKGFMIVSMMITFVCSVLNVGLDLLFVLVFHSGVLGTIIATAICWVAQFFISMIFCLCVKDLWIFFEALNFRHWKIAKSVTVTLIIFGLPSLFRNSLQGVAYYAFNIILTHLPLQHGHSNFYVSIFGSVTPFLTFFTISIFGFIQGMNMFTSHNIARGKIERVKKSIKLSLLMMLTYLVFIEIIVLSFAPLLVKIFVDSSQTLIYISSIKALRYTFILFPLIAFSFVPIACYQSLLCYKKAIFITFLRFILLYIPVSLIYFFIIEKLNRENQLLIFLSLPTSDLILSIIVSTDFYLNIRNLTMEKVRIYAKKFPHLIHEMKSG